MQEDLNAYLLHYNTERPHQGRGMNGRTPYQVFMDGLPRIETSDTTEELAA
jgi:hypothetical protein